MQIHTACIGRAHHAFVFLEDLLREPDDEWERICRFLGLRADIRSEGACSRIIADLEHEPWKRGAISGLLAPMKTKAEEMFTARFRLWLDEHLESYDKLRTRCLLLRNGAAAASFTTDARSAPAAKNPSSRFPGGTTTHAPGRPRH